MGNPRPKRAVQLLPLEVEVAYNKTLKQFGFKPAGETPMGGLEYVDTDGVRVVVDKNGWTLQSTMGRELGFGSTPKDLTPSLTGMFGAPTEKLPKSKLKQFVFNLGEPATYIHFPEGVVKKTGKYKKAYGLTNEGQAGAVCPNCHQAIADGERVNYTQNGMEAHIQCPAPSAQQPGAPQQAPGYQSRLNLPPGFKPKGPAPAKPGMISPNVGRPQASLIAKINRYTSKSAAFGEGTHHHFSFEVPMQAGGSVAYHLAKAGLDTFEANNYETENTTEFLFKTEPEMHIAEEIIRAEFAKEISSMKGGAWKSWAPKQEDPTAIKSEKEISQHLMSSDKTVYSEEDMYRELEVEGQQDKELHEQIENDSIFQSYEEALETALLALDTVAKLGPSQDITGCASMSAADLRQFAQEAKEGRARKFSADEAAYESTLEQVVAGLEKLAVVAPEDIKALASVYASDLRDSAQTHTVLTRQAAGAFDLPTFTKWINKIKTTSPEVISKLKVDTVTGALRLSYDGKPLGYLGFPLEEFSGIVEPIKRWIEKGQQHDPNFDPYQMEQTASTKKVAFDPTLATFVSTWVVLMLGKWLGDKWKERYGGVEGKLTQKAEEALQKAGVNDFATLDKYAQENGKNRMGALLAIAGRSLVMAAAMTTGIAVSKLTGGGNTAPAPTPTAITQPTHAEKTDMYIEPMPEQQQAPAPQQAPQRMTKQQQKQYDQQVLQSIHEQEKDRNPQNST